MESNYFLDSRTVAQMTPRRRSPGVDSSGNPIVIVHFFTEDEQGEEIECCLQPSLWSAQCVEERQR